MVQFNQLRIKGRPGVDGMNVPVSKAIPGPFNPSTSFPEQLRRKPNKFSPRITSLRQGYGQAGANNANIEAKERRFNNRRD
jgi:hypothetical protein